jgi:autotransporter-associated beta strand protein
MDSRIKSIIGALAAAPLLLLSGGAWASSVCPGINGGSNDFEGVSSTYSGDLVISGGAVQGNTGCNVLITVASGGSVSTSNPNAAASYDSGGDDNLVGIVNTSGGRINSITLTGNDIFGFDLDGACGADPGYTFVGGGSPCGTPTDPSGYAPQGVSFTVVNSDNGTVTFLGGIASGSTAWFSLEGPASLTAASITQISAPEPGMLALLGLSLAGLGFARKRK